MELENIILSEVSQALKVKSCMFSLSVDYRPKTNAAVLWHMGHTKGRLCTGEGRQGTETKS
jgi:hypothetical protein